MSDIQVVWNAITGTLEVIGFVEFLLKARNGGKRWLQNANEATARLRDAYARREYVSRVELTAAIEDLHRRFEVGGTPLPSEQFSADEHLERLTLLEAWQSDVESEPSVERVAMLEHASVSALDPRLDIGTAARIRRIIRELDPKDLLVLRGLQMMPRSAQVNDRDDQPSSHRTYGQSLHTLFHRVGAPDALLASGCLRSSVGGGGFGSGPHNELQLTTTARLVLEGTRSFFATRSPPFPIPGREPHASARTAEECWAILNAVPLLVNEARRHAARPRHSTPAIIDYRRAAEPHLGASLSIGQFERAIANEVKLLLPAQLGTEAGHGQPATRLVASTFNQDESAPLVGLSVEGPDDVIRALAEDLDAMWS